jgi:L-ascorbate metabolism protein UlaG (beta-lactamase superfamily)
MIKIRWLGAAGIELTKDDRTILIDPYLSRISRFNIFFGRPSPKKDIIQRYLKTLPAKLSAIIGSHTHFDHVLDVPEFAKLSGCDIVGSQSLDSLLTIHGQPGRVLACNSGKATQISGGIRVIMIPSVHGRVVFGRVPYMGEIDPNLAPPLKVSQYRLGAVFSSRVEVSGLAILHVGSANFFESELDGHHCDILFMCVPGWKTNPAYSTRLPEMLQPKIIIPIHFDDFSLPMSGAGNPPHLPFLDMDGFLKTVSTSAPGARVIIPTVFEETAF